MKSQKRNTAIVLDTNILISAALKPNSIASSVVRKAIEHYELCASEETIKELKETLQREKFKKYFDRLEYSRDQFIRFIEQSCVMISSSEEITDCNDPKDNKFLELAVAANASMLISGDKKHLLSMNPYRGIQIITAREFLTTNK